MDEICNPRQAMYFRSGYCSPAAWGFILSLGVHTQPGSSYSAWGSYSGCVVAPGALLRVHWNAECLSLDLNWVELNVWDMAPSQKGSLW